MPIFSIVAPGPFVGWDERAGRVPRRFWKAQFPMLQGIFTGGCVLGLGAGFARRSIAAHAHVQPHTSSEGWVCFREPEGVTTTAGWPSSWLWHEYAHIVTGQGHTNAWKRKLGEFMRWEEARKLREFFEEEGDKSALFLGAVALGAIVLHSAVGR